MPIVTHDPPAVAQCGLTCDRNIVVLSLLLGQQLEPALARAVSAEQITTPVQH